MNNCHCFVSEALRFYSCEKFIYFRFYNGTFRSSEFNCTIHFFLISLRKWKSACFSLIQNRFFTQSSSVQYESDTWSCWKVADAQLASAIRGVQKVAQRVRLPFTTMGGYKSWISTKKSSCVEKNSIFHCLQSNVTVTFCDRNMKNFKFKPTDLVLFFSDSDEIRSSGSFRSEREIRHSINHACGKIVIRERIICKKTRVSLKIRIRVKYSDADVSRSARIFTHVICATYARHTSQWDCTKSNKTLLVFAFCVICDAKEIFGIPLI